MVPILKAAPRGVVNQVQLAGCIWELLDAEQLGDAKNRAGAAERAAAQIRAALSHVRKLQQQPKKFKARSKGLAVDVVLAVKVILSHYHPDAEGPVPAVPSSWGGPSSADAEADSAPATPPEGASSAASAEPPASKPAAASPARRALRRLPSFNYSPPPIPKIVCDAEPAAAVPGRI